MDRIKIALTAFVTLALAGCATTLPPTGPVTVTRFHIDQPPAMSDVALEPRPGADPQSLEFQSDLPPIATELSRLGFHVVAPGSTSPLVAIVDVTRQSRPGPPRHSPVTIGIGGGFGGGGWHSGGGVGGGVAFPVGGEAGPDIVGTQLSIQLKRRSDGTVVWEGRAFMEARADAPQSAPDAAIARLASALFQGFPGESGRTITVK
ncbi:MAG: DUF4136 domain-containing protein [Sphingomonadaceae bacterium]|nr:DUF4136 domain-containing protein [Sphingomonadaceae bacterium]